MRALFNEKLYGHRWFMYKNIQIQIMLIMSRWNNFIKRDGDGKRKRQKDREEIIRRRQTKNGQAEKERNSQTDKQRERKKWRRGQVRKYRSCKQEK